MTRKRTLVYESILGGLIKDYIEEKRAVGYKFLKAPYLLKQFDTLLKCEKWSDITLPKNLVLLWTAKRPNETENNRSHRISIIRGFARYMVRLNYQAYIFPAAAITIARYSYTPYIFTESELKNLFTICDCYPATAASANWHIMLPVLFRLLYGCGLRISEALKLQTEEVDFKQGTLFIHSTKFGKERLVPMAKTLVDRCRDYAENVHRFKTSNPFFFPSPFGGRYNDSTIYHIFRKILWKAGISHCGRGPRLHDLRHTFAVHCLKKWVLNKGDLTNLLPYLSAYLGHEDLRGTQHYLRLTADLYPDILTAVEHNFSSLIPEVTCYESD